MYQNILVINLMHIGDLMLVTPVLRTLRANYPQARISLLADKKLADLVQYNKHIDECLLIDKKGKDDHFGSFFHFILSHFSLLLYSLGRIIAEMALKQQPGFYNGQCQRRLGVIISGSGTSQVSTGTWSICWQSWAMPMG